MLIGHFGAALAGKAAAPELRVGTCFLACMWADTLWPLGLLAGVERAHIDHHATVVTPLALDYMPWSHSLLMSVVWSLAFFAGAKAMRRTTREAAVLGAVVFSHFVLDVITHRPDMPIAFGDSPRLGLGLWNSLPGTLVVEVAIFAFGIFAYLRSTKALDARGRFGFWALVFRLFARLSRQRLRPEASRRSLAERAGARDAGPARRGLRLGLLARPASGARRACLATRRYHRGMCLALMLAVVAGCSGEPGPGDAGADADASEDGSTPTPQQPSPPTLPTLSPCPTGWAEVTGDLTTCEPWPASAPPACTGAEVRFASRPSCERLGTACPSDGVPVDAPTDALHVRSDAPPGGDGSGAAPFSSIGEALALAAAGTTIAIAAGEYVESLDVPAGVTLLGACVEGTVLHADETRLGHGVITATGADIAVHNLTVGASEEGGLWIVGADRSMQVSDVLIDGVRIVGVEVESGGHVDAERLVIRGVRPTASGVFGRGIGIESGSTATVRNLWVEGCTEFGVVALGAGSTLSFEDGAIIGTEATAAGMSGAGLVALDGGAIDASRVVLERNTDVGVAVSSGSIVLRDALVRTTRPRPMALDEGRGLQTSEGLLDLARVTIEDVSDIGVVAEGDAGELRMMDVAIRRVRSRQSDGGFGRAVSVQDGASAELQRLHVADTRENAFLLGGFSPVTAMLADITIVRTQVDEGVGNIGRGITVQTGSTATLSRLHIDDAYESGIVVTDEGSHADITDLIIENVESASRGIFPSGRGLLTQLGATTRIARARIENVRDVGIQAIESGAQVTATDIVTRGVVAAECGPGFCAPGGQALGAYGGAAIDISVFDASDAMLCGVHVADRGTAHLQRGVIQRAAIGACVQSDAQDIGALMEDVRYVDNGVNLQATTLPVPEPADPL